MSVFRKETEPLAASGRLFKGLLTLDERGLITNIALIVNGLLIEKDNAEQRAQAGVDASEEIRMRQVVKLRYFDKLTQELVNE